VQGQHLLEYPAIEGADYRGRLMALPVGQTCKRSDPGDTVLLGIEGDIEVTLEGSKLALKPLDLLGIPANTPYSCANPGLSNALMCGVYANPDPGAPGRAEAKPRHMIWEDYRGNFGWTQPGPNAGGITADPVRSSFRLAARHTVRMPPGQSTPWHFTVRDLMFMCIHNEWSSPPLDASGRSSALISC
jgi:quercetin dioxygenase-like cupin family protein